MVLATAFFIRMQNRLFLITASHVLTGCKRNGKDPASPNEFYVPIYTNLKDFEGMIKIDAKPIKDTFICNGFGQQSDIGIVEVKSHLSSKINSVEQFLAPPFEETTDIEIFGFAGKEQSVVDSNAVSPLSHLTIKSSTYFFHYLINPTSAYEREVYYVSAKGITIDSRLDGFSGSPVFIQDSASLGWRIVGLMSGYSHINDEWHLNFVKIEAITDKIKQLLKQ